MSVVEKKRRLAEVITTSFKTYFPRTTEENKAKILVQMVKDGDVFGVGGGKALEDEFVRVGSKKFTAWKILRGLDLDDHSGNYGTVEILREVEGVEYYKRGVFPASSTMSNRGRELNRFADRFVPFKCFRSSTGHRNIAFHYEKVVREILRGLGLLEKAEMTSVSVCFTLDFAEICKHSRLGHVLGGIKIVDVDTKYPGTDRPMFDDTRGGTKGGVHSDELTTCIPLHFVVGKESKEVFRQDMGQFFAFAERMRKEGLVARHAEEPTLKPFKVMYPMDMSAEQKCFDLGGACKVAEYFCIKCAASSNDLMFCWPVDSEFRCGEEWCVGERCYHMAVDDDEELERKKVNLRFLLSVEDGEDFEDVDHLEERVTGDSKMMSDPNVEGKEGNVEHIDFEYSGAINIDRGLFF